MKNRSPLAMLALLAVASAWLWTPQAQAQAQEQRLNCRIALHDTTFYVAVEGSQLKVAATPEGLEAAAPVKPSQTRRTARYALATFPPVEFPKPPGQADAPPVLATFAVRAAREGQPVLRGIVETSRAEANGNVWIYQRRIHADLAATPPQDAPMASFEPETKRFRLSGHFGRIRVDDNTVVFVAGDGKHLRLATTLEGLSKAQPIEAVRSQEMRQMLHSTFPPIELPKPEGADADAPSVTARYTYRAITAANRPPRHLLFATLDVPRVDAQGDVWTFRQSVSLNMTPEGPIGAPVAEVAKVDELELQVSIQEDPAPRTFGIVVQLKAGDSTISDVRRNNREVRAEVQVVRQDGRVVQRDSRPLRGLGFL